LPHLRRRLGLPNDRPLVAYLGLLAPYQGTDLLLEAIGLFLQRGGQAHFLIMGFPHLDRYQALAGELGVDAATTFTGPVPYMEAPQQLMLADLAVAPKISATEGSGKVLAYMAAGLPVVAFDTPVHREYLGDLGLYAPRVDAAALAGRLRNALADPAELKARGLALRDQALGSFGPAAIGQALRLAYQQLPTTK
jgi:glycosyltransferase involved in cell wall biosynthesis